MTHPLVVSYYTPGTAYEDKARQLAGDLRRLGLRGRIEPIASRGSWVENCAMKAGFIRRVWREQGGPILWLDADARLRRPLRELDGETADLAVVRRRGWSFYTGQIFFGPGPGAGLLLDRWCAYCEASPQVWDQVSLGYSWWDGALDGTLQTRWLDERVFERRSRKPWEALAQKLFGRRPILQLQESRRSKPTLARSPVPEFGNDRVPQWWRDAAARDAPFALDAARRRELGLLPAA